MDPGKLMRGLLAGSATLLAIVVMFWLQSKYETADRKAALGVVQEYRAHGGWTVPEVLDARHPGRPVHWTVEPAPACLHHYERVSAEIDGERYQFMVDIDNGPSIHPGNKPSAAVVEQLDEARPGWPPPAAAAPGDDGAPPGRSRALPQTPGSASATPSGQAAP